MACKHFGLLSVCQSNTIEYCASLLALLFHNLLYHCHFLDDVRIHSQILSVIYFRKSIDEEGNCTYWYSSTSMPVDKGAWGYIVGSKIAKSRRCCFFFYK